MKRTVVFCPAKINTFLAVGRPDASGYHPVRTVFRAVSLGDTLTIGPASGTGEVTSDWADMPEENTLTKTLRLARELLPIPPLHIHVAKRVPAQSGLGGGSADAGGLIRWLVREFGSAFPAIASQSVAAAVGADVPFAASGLAAATGQGYGELLDAARPGPPAWLVLARPSVGEATGSAYAKLDAQEFAWRELPSDPWEAYNDFERVASDASLSLVKRLRELGCDRSGLTGSGSAVWGRAEDEDHAAKVAASLKPDDVWAEGCRTLTQEDEQWTF